MLGNFSDLDEDYNLFYPNWSGKGPNSKTDDPLFENASDLIQSVNVNGTIAYVNNAWKNTLGYSEKEINERTIFDFLHPEGKEHCVGFFKNIVKNKSTETVKTTVDLIDKKGNKMSKRLGNAVNPFDTINKYGPDATRWYMIANANPYKKKGKVFHPNEFNPMIKSNSFAKIITKDNIGELKRLFVNK